jgi:hypothetical protein
MFSEYFILLLLWLSGAESQLEKTANSTCWGVIQDWMGFWPGGRENQGRFRSLPDRFFLTAPIRDFFHPSVFMGTVPEARIK